MIIKDLFEKDINRSINGVIKVEQDKQEEVYQELDEFVITKELRKHFIDFYASYNKSLDTNTDKIGVWISGFFGSGKSHFLKILSYLLENKEVNDKKAVEFFENKLDKGEMLFGDIKRASQPSTDVILFNIDSKSSSDSKTRKTAIVEVFLKVFNEHLGFCSEIPWLANIERILDEEGDYETFKNEYKNITSEDWVESRSKAYFIRDSFIGAMTKTKGISEESAAQLFDNAESNYSLTTEGFAKLVKKYLDSKGNKHRMVFLVDEIGQYIGDNTDLMLNLQTVTENLGTHCRGRAWVIVTSQEAIDAITKERFKDQDFSKIQGRFDTRLNLSAANTDEVIRKRLLAKTDTAKDTLILHYGDQNATLRNLISFSANTANMKAYQSEDEFIQSYPFIPYQFDLLQKVFECIRKFSHAGKHLSDGNRSMLNAFHSAAMEFGDKEVCELVPFNSFYKTVESFLDGSIKTIFGKAEDNDHLEPFDIEVLKVLFMIKYVKEVPTDIENIATLMINNFNTSKIELRSKIDASLARLKREILIQQNGGEYDFLTDEEQDVNRGIKKMNVDFTYVIDEISNKIFDDIYASDRYSFNKFNIYKISKQVDNKHKGKPGEDITIKVYTPEAEEYKTWTENNFKFNTDGESGAGLLLIKMPDDKKYIEEIDEILKTERFLKEQSTLKMTENVRKIVDGKRFEITQRKQRVTKLIEEALLNADYFASGSKLDINNDNNVKLKLEAALKIVVQNTFHKLSLIKMNAKDEKEIHSILTSPQQTLGEGNLQAETDMSAHISQCYEWNQKITMSDIKARYFKKPYGWALNDIAGVLAALFSKNEIKLEYNGENLDPTNRNLVSYLTKEKEFDKLVITAKQKIDQALIDNVKKLSRELFNAYDLSDDGEDLVKQVKDRYIERELAQEIKDLLSNYSNNIYPGKDVLDKGLSLFKELLSNRDTGIFLTEFSNLGGDLIEWKESFNTVKSFLTSPAKTKFEEALSCIKRFKSNEYYIKENAEILTAIQNLKDIVEDLTPYSKIPSIPENVDKFNRKFQEALNAKKQEIKAHIDNDWNCVKTEVEINNISIDTFKAGFDKLISDLEESKNFDSIMALKGKSQNQLEVSILILNKKLEARKATEEEIKKEDERPVEDTSLIESDVTVLITPKVIKQAVKSLKPINPAEIVEKNTILETEEDVDNYINKLSSVLKLAVKENRIKIS